MVKNPGRRAFIKKSLTILSGLPLLGCGGGGGGSSSSTSTPPAVTPSPVLPSFILQPSDQTISPGENATFQALANGSDPLFYQWQRNGSSIAGATGLSYTTPPVALGDNAQFLVLVTNDAGTVSSRNAQLNVAVPLVPPSIIVQPSDQSVVEGGQATFQILADGSLPLSYQWLRNGQSISGATNSSYTTPSLMIGDNATFSVTVTNDAGNATSLAAQLTVIANTITVDSVTVTVDSTLLTVDST